MLLGKHPIAPKDSPTYYSVVKYDGIPETGESGRMPLPGQKRPPYRILVVEDDPGILCLNTEMLICSGYHVDAAVNGAVAWDALQLNSYDLLITDHNMPELSGVELLKNLHTARMDLPVIMATGTLPEEFGRCPWLQPAATLLKPYTVEELLRTVTKVLRAG
jgi:DNA-binding response OmpR family regulator